MEEDKLPGLLNEVEEIFNSAQNVLKAIAARAELKGSWVMDGKAATSLVSAAASEATVKKIGEYILENIKPKIKVES